MISLSARKPLVYVTVLVLLNILLLSIQVRNEKGRLLIRSWSLLIFSPLATGVHFLTSGLTQVVSQYALLYNTEEENRRLRAENVRLKVKVSQFEGLKSFLSHRPNHQVLAQQFQFDALPAPVIWKSAPFYAHRLVVNAGSRQGAGKDGAVIAPEGIVGRVRTTTPFTSEVELITNSGAAAGGMLKDSRLQGVVQGDGSRLLQWNFIPNNESVEVGDVVYTSGTDRIYPKGIPIGRVVESQKGSIIHRDIRIKPLVDYLRLEEVMVIVSR